MIHNGLTCRRYEGTWTFCLCLQCTGDGNGSVFFGSFPSCVCVSLSYRQEGRASLISLFIGGPQACDADAIGAWPAQIFCLKSEKILECVPYVRLRDLPRRKNLIGQNTSSTTSHELLIDWRNSELYIVLYLQYSTV